MPDEQTYEIAGVFNMPDAGWFVRLVGTYPVRVGTNKPPIGFRPGARVRVTVELANEAGARDSDCGSGANQIGPATAPGEGAPNGA